MSAKVSILDKFWVSVNYMVELRPTLYEMCLEASLSVILCYIRKTDLTWHKIICRKYTLLVRFLREVVCSTHNMQHFCIKLYNFIIFWWLFNKEVNRFWGSHTTLQNHLIMNFVFIVSSQGTFEGKNNILYAKC